MDKLQTVEAIKVMQAFVVGKEIQSMPCNSSIWIRDCSPDWDWSQTAFRIAPKPERRPFNVKELTSLVGTCVVSKNHGGSIHLILALTLSSGRPYIMLGGISTRIEPEYLLKKYKFLDGTPCGTEEE